MAIKYNIILEEQLDNTERIFGSGVSYYPVYVTKVNGEEVPALFTEDQINIAIRRAERNLEDMPKRNSSLLGWLFN